MDERQLPQPEETWLHFKGNKYRIITLAEHSETNEKMVVYKALYGAGRSFIRPLAMFMSEVDHNKYPDAKQKYRFEKSC